MVIKAAHQSRDVVVVVMAKTTLTILNNMLLFISAVREQMEHLTWRSKVQVNV